MKWNFSEQINPHFCERQFFKEVLDKIQSTNILRDSFNFIVTNYDDNTLPLYEDGKRNIVIYLSDEYGIFKNWFNKVDVVFRTYPKTGNFDNKKIFAIPCGLVMPDYVQYKIEQPKKKIKVIPPKSKMPNLNFSLFFLNYRVLLGSCLFRALPSSVS